MKTEGVEYKYKVNDSFVLRIEELIDAEGEPAYMTNVGAIHESDLDNLETIEIGNLKAGSVLLIEVRQNDPDYRSVVSFDNWLDAYREMTDLVFGDSSSDTIEKAMKTDIIRIAQYSASVLRDEGRFFYYIIKLSNTEVKG